MGKACSITPRVKNNQGQEVDSKLFTELTSTFKNRELAKSVWVTTQTDIFKENILPKLEKDNNGEPTLKATIEALKLEDNIKDKNILLEELGAEKGKQEVYIKDYSKAIQKVLGFNNKYKNFIARLTKQAVGYLIQIQEADSISQAEKEFISKNNHLNTKIRTFLNSLGFDVGESMSEDFNGIFDPTNATETAEGLLQVIKIAKGQLGEQALPEEFAHFIIEGMQSHPLVQRMMEQLDNEEVVKQVLGSEYRLYEVKYQGNKTKLKKEALGKMLASHIKGEYVKSKNTTHSNLLGRIWNWAKNLFSKVTQDQITSIINEVNDSLVSINAAFEEGRLDKFLSVTDIMGGEALYQLKEDVEKLKDHYEELNRIKSKQLALQRNRERKSTYKETDKKAVKELRKQIDNSRYAGASMTFISHTLDQLKVLEDQMLNLQNLEGLDVVNGSISLQSLASVSKVLKNIKDFKIAYESLLRSYSIADSLYDELGIEVEEATIAEIKSKANEALALLTKLDKNYRETRFDSVKAYLSLFWKDFTIGDKLYTLEETLRIADQDIGFFDKYLGTMSSASDPVLSAISAAVRTSQKQRDLENADLWATLRALDNKLTESGYSNDFMYERDEDGIPTGRYISNIDWDAYYKARREARESFKKEYGENNYTSIEAAMVAWEMENTETKQVGEQGETILSFPKASIYYSGVLDRMNLSKEQMDYYNGILELKAKMESYLPEGSRNLYKVPQVRKDNTEVLTDDTMSVSTRIKLRLKQMKDKFLTNVEDDTSLGERDSSGEVVLGLDGRPIKRVPVFYKNTIKDKRLLVTNTATAMTKYIGMAVNYKVMSEVQDIIELTSDLVKEREIIQMSGMKSVKGRFKALGSDFEENYTEKGGDIYKRLEHFLELNLWGRERESYEIEAFGMKVDVIRFGESIKEVAGSTSLAYNFTSALGNLLVGKIQIFIESMSGEYFKYSDNLWAEKEFADLIGPYILEINSDKKTNKLALLLEKFDPTGEMFQQLSNEHYYSGVLSRAYGRFSPLFGHGSGELYLQSKVMLAMLSATKVKLNGQEVSLYEAYEVVTESDYDGTKTTLKLKEGVTNLDGTEFTETNITPDGKFRQSDLTKFSLKLKRVNQALNGAFSSADKGMIHKYILGRLAMQFKQWIPEHVARRYAGAYYDAELGQVREGFYRTSFNFVVNAAKQIKNGEFVFSQEWGNLTDHQKANVRRAITEVSLLATLAIINWIMGAPSDKKNKNSWFRRMFLYQIMRSKLEISAFTPSLSMFSNIHSLFKNPFPFLKPYGNLLGILNIFNMFDEVKTGRYKGYSKWNRDLLELMPAYNNIDRFIKLGEDSSSFNALTPSL